MIWVTTSQMEITVEICHKGLFRALSALSMADLVLYINSSGQKKRSFDVLSASFHTIF